MNDVKCFSIPDSVVAACMVIAGEYGTGEERKKRLEADGFDYEEVRKVVNALKGVIY